MNIKKYKWVVWVGIEDYFFMTKTAAEDFAKEQMSSGEWQNDDDVIIQTLECWYKTQETRLGRWH